MDPARTALESALAKLGALDLSEAELEALASFAAEGPEVEGFAVTTLDSAGLDPTGIDVLGSLTGAVFTIGGTTNRKRPGRAVTGDLGDFHA